MEHPVIFYCNGSTKLGYESDSVFFVCVCCVMRKNEHKHKFQVFMRRQMIYAKYLWREKKECISRQKGMYSEAKRSFFSMQKK